MKKLFTITLSSPAIQTWTYEVVAESEEEALDIVQNGDAEVSNYAVDADPSGLIDDEFEVINVTDYDEE